MSSVASVQRELNRLFLAILEGRLSFDGLTLTDVFDILDAIEARLDELEGRGPRTITPEQSLAIQRTLDSSVWFWPPDVARNRGSP